MVEVDSRTNNWREVFLGFQVEYLHIVCQIEWSHQQLEQFACHVQHFLSALIHLRLIVASPVFL